MLKKTVEAIIKDGLEDLQRRANSIAGEAEQAQKDVQRCAEEIKGLVALAKEIPDKVFARYSSVLTASLQIYDGCGGFSEIRLGHCSQATLRGLMGDEQIKSGKYRVIVLLEPIQ